VSPDEGGSGTAPSESQPQKQTPSDSQRQVLRTSTQDQPQPDFDMFSGFPVDTSSLGSVKPDELPALLSAGSPPTNLLNGQPGNQANSLSSGSPFSAISPPVIPGGISNDDQAPEQQAPPQAARRPVASGRSSSNDAAAFRRRPNPYANVPSLFDLYEQVS